MSKKVQKTLTGAMAAMMATGVVATPAMAATNNTDVDALYKAAYQATQKALTEKTQAAVNEARAAIKALPAKLDWAIGEFSKQVDTIQHPILVNIVNAIKTAEKTPTQANINAAKKAIPAELTAQWKNSYSSAVDKIQQGLMNKAAEAVKKAEKEKTQAAIDAAKALLADLATADSQAIKDWAKTLTTKIEAIKIYDLEITKATLSKTGVTVEFKALEEAVRNATLEVIDGEGNVVEVETKSVLIEGETTWSFKFKTALTSRPEGTWKINGFVVEQDEVNLVEDVKKATDSQKLFTLLEKSGLVENLVDELENHAEYLKTIQNLANSNKLNTLEDIQKAIDDSNAEIGTEVKAEDVVKAANDTLNKFKAIFAKLNIERVNTSWISSYKTEIAKLTSSIATISDIQAKVDLVNKKVALDPFTTEGVVSNEVTNKATILTDGKLDITKIDTAIGYVENYVVVDSNKEDEVKAKAAKIQSLEILRTVAELNEADTIVSFKAGLKNLEKVVNNKNIFEYASLVNEDIISYYVKANTQKSANVNEIKAILADGQVNARKEAVSELAKKAEVVASAEKITDSQKNDLLNAYKNLAKVTAKNEKFDINLIKSDLLENYAQFSNKYDENTQVSTITGDVKYVNDNIESIAVKEINNATTKEELLKALKNPKLSLSNIEDTNIDAYINEINIFRTVYSKENAQNTVNAINSAQIILNSNSIDEISNAILNFAVSTPGVTITSEDIVYKNSKVINLSTLVRKDVAEEVKEIVKDYENLQMTSLAINIAKSIVSQDGKITNVNNAKDNVTMVASLNNVSSEFKNLSEVNKIAVAEKFISKFPTHKDSNGNLVRTNFVNYTEIRTLLAECMK